VAAISPCRKKVDTRLAWLGGGSLGYLAACRQIGPIHFKGKLEQGDDMFAAGARYSSRKCRSARLRRQTQRPGLHGLFGPDHRRLAEEFDLLGADHAMGAADSAIQKCGDFIQ